MSERSPSRFSQGSSENFAPGSDQPSTDLRLLAMQRRRIQRKKERDAKPDAAVNIPTGGGAPLPAGARARMESTLKSDFSSVRVHTGGDSAQAADDLGAKAFTDGNDVHFGAGQFAPGTREGDHLLAHELTHVAAGQGQSGVHRSAASGAPSAPGVSEPGDSDEVAAEASADSATDALHGPNFGAPIGKVTTKTQVNIRAVPSSENNLPVDKLDKGASVDILGKSGPDWYMINTAQGPRFITASTKYVNFAPAPPAPEGAAPGPGAATPGAEAPEAEAPEGGGGGFFSSMFNAAASGLSQLAGKVESGLESLASAVGFGEPGPPEPEPVEGQPGVEAPEEEQQEGSGDASTEVTQLTQDQWYGIDGSPLSKEDKENCINVLTPYNLIGTKNTNSRSDAYSDYLRLPSGERPAQVTYWASGANKEEDVPADIAGLPQIAYIPGGASCLRTAKAMAAQTGAQIEGGSGVQTSHIQMILDSDQEAVLDEDGDAKKSGDYELRDTKSTEELGEDRVAKIQANVALARSYMDAELTAGRAVVIGVSYTDRNGNKDKTTDHWMCVYAKVGDGYSYFDPGKSGDNGKGMLQVNPEKGGILEGQNAGRTYSLAQVQLNTASSGAPSDEDVNKTWSQVAAEGNAELAEGAPEQGDLGWK